MTAATVPSFSTSSAVLSRRDDDRVDCRPWVDFSILHWSPKHWCPTLPTPLSPTVPQLPFRTGPERWAVVTMAVRQSQFLMSNREPHVLTISGKTAGRRKPLFEDFGVPLPPDFGEGRGLTLRDLIERVVSEEIDAFKKRQSGRQLIRCLSADQIEVAAEQGKVDSGGRALRQHVDEDAAVATALTAFEDGIYLVVIDGEERRCLDDQIFLQADSRMTFIRLALLAGG